MMDLQPSSQPVQEQLPAQQMGFDPVGMPTPQPHDLSRYDSGEAQADVAPTRWERFFENTKNAARDTVAGLPFVQEGAIQRGLVQSEMESRFESEGRTKISPEEANKRYPGLPVAFDKPIYPELADLIASDNNDRKNSSAWASRGETHRFDDFLSGLAAGALDPFNLAIGIATGAAGRAFFEFGKTAQEIKAMNDLSKTLPLYQQFGRSYVQNAAVGLVGQVPSYLQNKAEFQNPSISGEIEGALSGAAIGTAFHFAVIKPIIESINTAKAYLKNMSDSQKEAALSAAVSQHEIGSKTDIAPITKEMAERNAGVALANQQSYEFRNPAHPSDIPHYMAKNGDNASVQYAERGPGVQGVSDQQVANNFAADPNHPMSGKIGEMDLKDKNFIDLEKPITDKEVSPFVTELEKKFGPFDLPQNATVKDLVDVIADRVNGGGVRPEALSETQAVAKSLGFDGYKEIGGPDGANRSQVTLFDENHIPSNEVQANPDTVPRASGRELQAYSERANDPAASRNYDPGAIDKNRVYKKEPAYNSESHPDFMDPVISEQEAMAKRKIDAIAKVDPTLKEDPLFKQMLRDQATAKQEKQLQSNLADCIGRAIL